MGEFPVQSQKRGVSNCFRRPEFCQRGQNSSAGNGVVGSRGRWERPLPVFVRQAARGGRTPASGSSKKHHRFFLWPGNSPKAAPGEEIQQQPHTGGRIPLAMRQGCAGLADVIKTEGRCERFYKIYRSNCEAVGKNPRPLFVLYREI